MDEHGRETNNTKLLDSDELDPVSRVVSKVIHEYDVIDESALSEKPIVQALDSAQSKDSLNVRSKSRSVKMSKGDYPNLPETEESEYIQETKDSDSSIEDQQEILLPRVNCPEKINRNNFPMASPSFLASPNMPGAGSSGTGLAHQLPKLTSETELQKLLADERMRSQMHKTNFEQLKEEHRRLQDEYSRLEDEIKKTIEESKIVQEKYKSMYEQSRKEVTDLTSELEEVKSKVVTPKRLEIMRMQIVEEVEKTYKERYQKQDQEIEEYRTAMNKIKYELSFMKSEYDHQTAEYQRILEELKLQHEAEVTNLRKERETVLTKINTENYQDSERVHLLQRENAQLHLKLKTYNTELEEMRALKEKQGIETESLTRTQNKQITEHTITIKTLQVECESLRKQVEQLQRDLASSGDTHNKLTSNIHELEKENTLLKNRVDEVTHKSKVEATNVKMDMLKQRGDLERERDKLANIVEDMQTKLEISKHTIDQQSRALSEKERDVVRRVQAAREEEFIKLAKVENEKLELETKLQENDKRRIDEDAYRHAEKEKIEERIRAANDAKDAAEREVLVLKTKLSHHHSVDDQLERERSENSELKSKIHRLESELSSFGDREHDITDESIRLRNQVELLKEELKLTKSQLHKIQDNHDLIISQQKTAFIDDKSQLELRVHELQEKLGQVQKKYQKALLVYKKYKKKSLYVIDNAKDKLALMEAKNEELSLEKKALEQCVPQDTFNRLKKQWKDLQRRHNEFRRVLLCGVTQVPIGDLTFANMSMPLDATFLPNNVSFTEQERKHQHDLKLLKMRLENLDSNQKNQLEEYQEIAHSTLRDNFPELDDKIGLETSKEKADVEKASM